MNVRHLSRVKLATALSLMSVACLEAADPPHAILVKQGEPVAYDKLSEPVEGLYGPKDNLDGNLPSATNRIRDCNPQSRSKQ